MKKDLQEIELTIKDIEDGIFAISLVSSPAIELPFVALSSDEVRLKVIDEEKRIVVGYALIPDKRIYRRVEDKEFNIYFTADTVKLASEMYMKQLNLNNVTVEHEKKVSDVGIIESWITEDKKHDKINLYGLEPIVGGWAIMMKVNNETEWAKVKEGEYRGFSIEGKFAGFEQLMSKTSKMDIIEELKELINTELRSEKVELALIDDLAKLVNRMKAMDGALAKSVQKTVNALSTFAKVQNDLKDGYLTALADKDDAESDLNEAVSIVEKIAKQAKELGMNPNDVKGVKEVVSLTANIEDTIQILERNESDIKKIMSI